MFKVYMEACEDRILKDVTLLNHMDVFSQAKSLIANINDEVEFFEPVIDAGKYKDMFIPVKDEESGKTLYYLKWESNHGEFGSDEFLWYDSNDPNIDFTLLDRGEVFIFLEFEEYTHTIARLIQEKYGDEKTIIFRDKRASLLWGGREVLIIDSIGDIYQQHEELLSKVIFTIDSRIKYIGNYYRSIIKRYHSIDIMYSLFWSCKRQCFGTENPDKTFVLIKYKLRSSGLVDLIKYALYIAEMAYKKGMIPVIDMSAKEENGNGFTGGDGTVNAWGLFFENITEYSPEEVYRSRNVILADKKLVHFFNPYVQEVSSYVGLNYLVKKFLRFKPEIQKYMGGLYNEIITPKLRLKKGLAVIGRGTDYTNSKDNFCNHNLAGDDYVEVVAEFKERKGYDYIFLCTEDLNIYNAFMESRLKDCIICEEQERYDYLNDESTKGKYIVEVNRERGINMAEWNLKYLGLIYIMSKMSGLYTNMGCGAFLLAHALNDGKYDDVVVWADR